MGWNDCIGQPDSNYGCVICRCGARYRIYEDDGVPGCRDIETVNCRFCGRELARHYGTCEGTLVDDKAVSDVLKKAHQEYAMAVQAYVQKNGYDWSTDEYTVILKQWQDVVKSVFDNLDDMGGTNK